MLARVLGYFRLLRGMQRVNLALSRGAAGAATRRLDASDPATWEFCGFSQNGEDGVLDVLTRRLREPNRCFIEIGCSDFIENNTTWLALARKYAGLMIDGDPANVETAKTFISFLNLPMVRCERLFVTRESAPALKELAPRLDPDVFSLDIDGNDLHVARALLDAGFRPKIWAVEYNAIYGPDKRLTIEYQERFRCADATPSGLYFGASIAAWRALFEGRGYRFVTVESNGVNAFFADPAAFETGFLEAVKGRSYIDGLDQRRTHKAPWDRRFELVKDQRFVEA